MKLIKTLVIQNYARKVKESYNSSFFKSSEQAAVTNREQSQVLTVTGIDGSVEEAQRIVDEIMSVFQEQVTTIMNVGKVSILSPSNLGADTKPVSPNPLINIMVGLAIGLILAFSRGYLDKSIKDEDNGESYLDIPTEELVVKTEFDMLDVITSGSIPPNPSELLSSRKLAQFIETSKFQYEMIIMFYYPKTENAGMKAPEQPTYGGANLSSCGATGSGCIGGVSRGSLR